MVWMWPKYLFGIFNQIICMCLWATEMWNECRTNADVFFWLENNKSIEHVGQYYWSGHPHQSYDKQVILQFDNIFFSSIYITFKEIYAWDWLRMDNILLANWFETLHPPVLFIILPDIHFQFSSCVIQLPLHSNLIYSRTIERAKH